MHCRNNHQHPPALRPTPVGVAHGFTLIELLVVMTLIALLLTLAVPRYFAALEAGKIRVQQRNVATLRDAIDKFFADQGRYPQLLDELVEKKYLRQIPQDPITESSEWEVVSPPDPSRGAVYDVKPVADAVSAAPGGQ